ncbi:MAG: hypothetical protein PUB15_05190 [Ruminobacter sp.]|nr:hypothetical protein [Ruminobacter sp.]MDY5779471.1 hypothetical protein [Succinivibrionaceae bacterium]
MKITLALTTFNNEKDIIDCLDAVIDQRIIKASIIKVYDLGSTDKTLDYLKQFSVELTSLDPNEYQLHHYTKVFNYIVNDNKECDILIHLSPFMVIDGSAISEIFRLFLKFEDLALVYGRQTPQVESSLITKFCYRFNYPTSKKDLPYWHMHKVFCSFRFVAFRTKFLLEDGILPPDNVDTFLDVYVSAKLNLKGYRTNYNPFAIAISNENITLSKIYKQTKFIYKFVNKNPWFNHRWNIRKNELAIFCDEMDAYIKEYSTFPFYSLISYVCYLLCITAKYQANRECKQEYLKQESKKF